MRQYNGLMNIHLRAPPTRNHTGTPATTAHPARPTYCAKKMSGLHTPQTQLDPKPRIIEGGPVPAAKPKIPRGFNEMDSAVVGKALKHRMYTSNPRFARAKSLIITGLWRRSAFGGLSKFRVARVFPFSSSLLLFELSFEPSSEPSFELRSEWVVWLVGCDPCETDVRRLAGCDTEAARLFTCRVEDARLLDFKYGPKKFTNAARHARCGYFGPQGSAVIVSTICGIFTGVFSHIRRHLSEVIRDQIIASPNSFDSETRKSPPAEILPFNMFLEFVLVPHIATQLIADHTNGTFLHADNIQTASSEFGDMFNWDLDDEDFQLIEQTNLDAAANRTDNHFANYSFSRSPSVKSLSPPSPPNKKSDAPAPNHAPQAAGPPKTSRKSVFAAVIEPDVTDIELTLDDFPPRGSKTTKSKANTKSEQKTDKKVGNLSLHQLQFSSVHLPIVESILQG
ncbi:hypothetical protein K438DRAFT_1765643 [Mycena galopus ATCC 62051]|nr:hypothetical protein K438DRAFT_1765643 [Mycena galopus ATCC 62051]